MGRKNCQGVLQAFAYAKISLGFRVYICFDDSYLYIIFDLLPDMRLVCIQNGFQAVAHSVLALSQLQQLGAGRRPPPSGVNLQGKTTGASGAVALRPSRPGSRPTPGPC